MKRFLVDLDVVLDVLLERQPFEGPATLLWSAIEKQKAEAFVAAHGLTTIYYLAQTAKDPSGRRRGVRFARSVLGDILAVFRVAAVDEIVVRKAVTLDWSDFEDAVSAAAAQACRCQAIVTRNLAHFRDSPVQAVEPTTALAWLGQPRG